jgi:hypothetical protein
MTKFTETQAFLPIAYGILGLSEVIAICAMLATSNRLPAGLYWLVIIPLVLVGNLLCQKTTVNETNLTVTFGALFPLYRRQIARTQIATAEAVTYSPLADYGGWGIRGWGKNVALNARGNRGVCLALHDGHRVLIGSQRPEDLAKALAMPR